MVCDCGNESGNDTANNEICQKNKEKPSEHEEEGKTERRDNDNNKTDPRQMH